MRGVLNLLLSIAAGAAIGVIIPHLHLPFLDDAPPAERYRPIQRNADAPRRQQEDIDDFLSQSEESVSSHPESQYDESSSERTLSVHSEPVQRITQSPSSSASSIELLEPPVPTRDISPPATSLPVPREVSIIRDVDVLALLQTVAPRSVSKHSGDAKCTFCIEPICVGQESRTTPCKHIFHALCLEKWVLYATASLMNVAAYWLAHDGSIQYKSRFPFCPNCSRFLDVVPKHEWRVVLLTALAVTLSVDSANQAVALYERNVVVRDRSDPPVVIHIGADEYGFRPRWMDESEDHHYTFVARNEGYRVLLRVLAYPIVSSSESLVEQES